MICWSTPSGPRRQKCRWARPLQTRGQLGAGALRAGPRSRCHVGEWSRWAGEPRAVAVATASRAGRGLGPLVGLLTFLLDSEFGCRRQHLGLRRT